MAFGQEIYNLLPNEAYMLVHIIAALLGFYLASKSASMGKEGKAWMPLFALYGVSEVLHLATHMGVFTLPFTHLAQEVLLLVGFVLGMMGMKK